MARTPGSNGQRLDNAEKNIKELRKEMEQSKKAFDNHITQHIVEDLQKTKFIGSGKPLYTYQEIADKHNVSKSRVQRTAEETALSRRRNSKSS